MSRPLFPLLLAVCTLPVGEISSLAAPLSGVIQLPRKFAAPARFTAPGYWKNLRNEVLRIQPPLQDPRQEMVVTLQGNRLSQADQVKPVARLRDMRLVPPVLPVRPGASITVTNDNRVTHKLTPAEGTFIEPTTLRPDEKTTVSLNETGEFKLKCGRYPHVRGSILVLDAPRFVLPDAAGAFRFADVPDGTYTLKIWFRGKWLHSQTVKVKRKTSVTVQLPAGAAKE